MGWNEKHDCVCSVKSACHIFCCSQNNQQVKPENIFSGAFYLADFEGVDSYC